MIFKYLVFGFALLVGVPCGILFGMADRRVERFIWGGFVGLGVMVEKIAINVISFETYRGTSRGMEITLVDLLVLILLGIMLLQPRVKFRFWAPGLVFYLIYWLLSIISVSNAESTLYSFTELWKMFRMLLYFIVAYNYLVWRHDFKTLLIAWSVVIFANLFQCLFQKYVQGIYQTSGLLLHQNSMAMYMEMLGAIYLSLWLNLRMKMRPWTLWAATTFILCSGAVFLSFSRGAIVLYPAGCAFVMLMSMYLRYRPRMLKIGMCMGMVGLLGFAAILPSIIDRFESAPKASKDTRVNLAIAARNMANDKFFGVGINNWGIKINPPYTYSEHRTSGRYSEDFKDGLVETIYMMVAAECGWIGLVSLVGWFLYYGFLGLRLIFRYRYSNYFYLPLGVTAGLGVAYVHSVLEWVLKQTPNFYQLMLLFAILAALKYFSKHNRGILFNRNDSCPQQL